ncbi:hypothetical protein DSO57_1036943 [Entomophthora muscae]|uniref:Uncharacterized protein n=1 Tax=Entomophthora muscae TaxID=34485 RepID=A0ACC2SC46_9FUNG|nr:hypothetical protein DSO57_1036943 [Entomophthora muscae]
MATFRFSLLNSHFYIPTVNFATVADRSGAPNIADAKLWGAKLTKFGSNPGERVIQDAIQCNTGMASLTEVQKGKAGIIRGKYTLAAISNIPVDS